MIILSNGVGWSFGVAGQGWKFRRGAETARLLVNKHLHVGRALTSDRDVPNRGRGLILASFNSTRLIIPLKKRLGLCCIFSGYDENTQGIIVTPSGLMSMPNRTGISRKKCQGARPQVIQRILCLFLGIHPLLVPADLGHSRFDVHPRVPGDVQRQQPPHVHRPVVAAILTVVHRLAQLARHLGWIEWCNAQFPHKCRKSVNRQRPLHLGRKLRDRPRRRSAVSDKQVGPRVSQRLVAVCQCTKHVHKHEQQVRFPAGLKCLLYPMLGHVVLLHEAQLGAGSALAVKKPYHIPRNELARHVFLEHFGLRDVAHKQCR